MAGADIIITNTYNTFMEAFKLHGLNVEESEEKVRLAVDLAKQAVEDFWAVEENRVGRIKPFVAGSIGSYGAYLPNAEEFTGQYYLTEK